MTRDITFNALTVREIMIIDFTTTRTTPMMRMHGLRVFQAKH